PTLGSICTDPLVALDAQRDLYGSLLFQGSRFRRIAGFRRLQARECVVELQRDEASHWFTPPLPQDLVLGDPGVRDAAVHAIQACIPNASLLPVGVDRVVITGCSSSGPLLAHAVERQQRSDLFVYDLE